MSLKQELLLDLAACGIDIESMELELRPFHSKFNGQYYFEKNKVVVYVYTTKERVVKRPYFDLLETAVHEGVHHMMNLESVVMKGSEHTERFWELYNLYIDRAKVQWLRRLKKDETPER